MPISSYLARLRAHVGHERLFAPAVAGIVFDDAGRVLLHRSVEDGCWHTIGGVMDPGEEPADTVVREVLEETGIVCVPERLCFVGATPPVHYANGDEMVYLALVFRCRAVDGELHVADDESLDVAFFAPDALPELPPYQRHFVAVALADAVGTFVPPTIREERGG